MSPRDERSKHVHADPPAAATAQGLVDRSALALIAVERTRMPMVVTDPRQADNPIILANQAFLNLTGYTAEEVVGRNCRFLQGPDTSPLVVAELASAIAEPRQITVEIKNYRKDGTPFWNELHLSPIHDDAGELAYFFASQIDRTEYRKVVSLEAAEHRLLKEVDHRALNVLAIVQGIVRLSRSEDPARYARAVQARVQVLATAHSLLAERKWSHIPMDRLVQRYVEPFGIRREALAGPPAPVRAEIVQPLAIVLHELADNAVTHGALSAANGSVRISWDLDADQSLQLRWVETGGPPPAAVRGRGFGSLMIAAIIDRQLKGRSELDWSPEGLSARITIPQFETSLPTDEPERDARGSGALRGRAEGGGLTA